jgi:hypothetical protein
MSEGSAEANRDARSNISSREIRSLTQTRSPQDQTHSNTNNQLCCGQEPMSVDHVGSLLVVDVVKRVTGIPGNDQESLCKED